MKNIIACLVLFLSLFSFSAQAHRRYWYPVYRYREPYVQYGDVFAYHYGYPFFHIESQAPLSNNEVLRLYDIYRRGSEEFNRLFSERTHRWCDCQNRDMYLYVYDYQIGPGANNRYIYVNYRYMFREFSYYYGRLLSYQCNVEEEDYGYYSDFMRNRFGY